MYLIHCTVNVRRGVYLTHLNLNVRRVVYLTLYCQRKEGGVPDTLYCQRKFTRVVYLTHSNVNWGRGRGGGGYTWHSAVTIR